MNIKMKKLVNVILAAFLVALKYVVVAPLYILVQPFITAYNWGFCASHYMAALWFECRVVWHALRDDWHELPRTVIYDLR